MFKKFLAIAVIVAACYSCNNNETKSAGGETKDTTAAKPAEPAVAANPEAEKGKELIAGDNCLTCHKIDEAVTGPAYRDVANKYSNDDETVTKLANKIIKGGSGVWGQIAMTPHDTLSVDNAKLMVKYILSLKNK